MPIPQAILTAFGIAADLIEATASYALKLIDLWNIVVGNGPRSQIGLRFANAYRSANPGASGSEVSQMYSAARYWGNQQEVFSDIDPDVVIDPAMALLVKPSSADVNQGKAFRYNVAITVTFPDTGDQRTFFVDIPRNNPSTQSGVFSEALETMLSYFGEGSLPQSRGGLGPELEFDIALTQFVQYDGGVR